MLKKNILLTILSALLLLLLVACGGNSNNEEDSSSKNQNGNENSETPSSSSGEVRGVTDTEIVIGHLGPQSGVLASYDYVRQGIEAYFNYVNENGGVHGRQLKLVYYDDQYQPAKTIQLAPRLVEEDKVFAMIGNVGTATNAAAKDYFDKQDMMVFMHSSGSSLFSDPHHPNWVGTSVSNYNIETMLFLDYAVNKLDAKKIAVVYQADDFGKEPLETLKAELPSYEGVEIVLEAPYVTSDTDLSSQVQHIVQADPDVIIAFATPNPAANLRKELHRNGLHEKPYMVISGGANDLNLFELAGKDVWEGTISASTVLMPDESDSPGMQVYLERMAKDFPNAPVAGVAQYGWSAAEVFVEILERTGKELNYDTFREAMYTLDNWTGSSMYPGITFAEGNHYGFSSLYLTEAKDGKIVPISQVTFDPVTKEITY